MSERCRSSLRFSAAVLTDIIVLANERHHHIEVELVTAATETMAFRWRRTVMKS